MTQAESFIMTAENEVGYLEKRSDRDLEDKTANAGTENYTKYGKWYGLNGQPWCAMFVSWCALKAGISEDIIPRHASCLAGITWFKSNGCWKYRDEYWPKAGDIIYFQRNTDRHVGIVYKSDNKKVYTIEGNTSGGSTMISNGGGVAKKSYDLDYSRIYGYGVPKYCACEEKEEMTYDAFEKFMDKYLEELAEKEPSSWSGDARQWAEEAGLIKGDEKGNKQYKAFCTREQFIVMLQRFEKMIGETKTAKID